MDNVRERREALKQQTEQWKQQTRTREQRQGWRLTWRVAALAVLGLALARPAVVQANTFHCSAGDVQCLIDAINTANANGTTNTIRLEAGTYTLTAVDNGTGSDTTGLPVLTSVLTITGGGTETTIIERDASVEGFRLLRVAATGILTLERLTLRGGDSLAFGGGIANDGGTVTLTDCALTHNTAELGGGIANDGGTVTLTDCALTRNTAELGGGGIANLATGATGGIATGGTVTLTNITLAHNDVFGDGGSISNSGTLTLTNCTLTDNVATAGGGISNSGTLTLTNCTLTDNVATAGGGITSGGLLTLTNCTLTDNAAGDGGGITSGGPHGPATLQNTILALNRGIGPTSSTDDCRGDVTSLGNNLIGDPTGCTIPLQPSDLTGDPGLDTFTDNGRPGKGHFPLLPTSQAIDAGNDAGCLRTDQLGQRRIGPCDIGTIRLLDNTDVLQEDNPATAAQETR